MANQSTVKQRFWAFLVTGGIGILLFRSIHMLFMEQALSMLVSWVAALLLAEALVDLLCVISALRWFINGKVRYAWFPLRLAAVAVVLHAIRVIIYVLGRTGPNKNFDINREFREFVQLDWFWVYSSAAIAGVGLIAVFIVWLLMRNRKQQD